jgi:hypothetical protein
VKAADIDTVKRRIDRHVITVFDAVGEIYSLPVDYDDVHFGMWNAKGFDHVLDRSRAAQRMRESAMPPLPRQEVIQLSVKAKSAHDCMFDVTDGKP